MVISRLLKSGLAVSVAMSLGYSLATAKELGAELWGTPGDQDAKFMKMTKKMEEMGFVISDPHPHINMGYEKFFGSTKLDNLGFFSTAHDEKVRKLLEKYPELGGFTPFNLHIFKKKGKNTTWVGHLRPEVMADIVGLEDPQARAEWNEIFRPLDQLIIKEMGATKVKNLYFDTLPEKTMMKFVIDVDMDEYDNDVETFAEEFQEQFEEVFEKAGYLIAGYKNIKETYDDMEKEFKYPAYWVYSLCHFPFSNAIFNDVPEAGIFAPCSLYMYLNEEQNKLYIGMPTLANWIKVANITDPEKIKMIENLDKEIVQLFVEKLGAKEID
ncbi:MAG TPA: hypothetical protein EYO61_01450 [Campylobacterales bacterium]|nr:hypothetical protein [Campylobacterales bacterium]HIO70431.1 hypothetical protein [Campylobacterales bacterium]